MTPIVKISTGTLGLKVARQSPIQATILPDMHTGLSPNLLISPPVNGPRMDKSPHESEPAHARDDIGDSKCSFSGNKSTPKAPKRKPSKIPILSSVN